MDCFDPFKDYLELSLPRGDMVENEESPEPQMNPERVADNGWLSNHGTRDRNSNYEVSGPIIPCSAPLTPGSSSYESARPLLGRRDSLDEVLPQPNECNLPCSQMPAYPSDQCFNGARNAQTTSNMWDYNSSSTVTDRSTGTWGNNCDAWTDLNSEISGHLVPCSNGVDRGSLQNTPTVWNGDSQASGGTNGVYSSTGFFGNIDPGQSNHNETLLGNCASQTLNKEMSLPAIYPRYSNGLNMEYQEYVGHVANYLGKLLQQGNTGAASAENGYRNYCSLDKGKFCAFCKRNKERHEFYTTHVVKDSWGKVICPILRKYVCPICGATGDNAHTIRHCPSRTLADLN